MVVFFDDTLGFLFGREGKFGEVVDLGDGKDLLEVILKRLSDEYEFELRKKIKRRN